MTETAAILRLSRCGVSVTEKLISGAHDRGLKVWSAVDCLCNYHGYTLALRPKKHADGKRYAR